MFLVRAKNSTYITSNNVILPSKPNSKDYRYTEGEYTYMDTYLGNENFAGEEAVWIKDNPIYAMNYYGKVLSETFNTDFLKEVLALVSYEKPFRGPEFHQKGDYTYYCQVNGDFDFFYGEEKYELTRKILTQLKHADCSIILSTKSDLILRDLDILKELKNLTVGISINTLDDGFQKDMDNASSISRRIAALKELHSQGIYTVLFMSPIFPYITNFREIIEATFEFVCEYWFENLNLRGDYKQKILEYISEKYPQFLSGYKEIYCKKNLEYWQQLSKEIDYCCAQRNIKYTNFFYHSLLVSQKKGK